MARGRSHSWAPVESSVPTWPHWFCFSEMVNQLGLVEPGHPARVSSSLAQWLLCFLKTLVPPEEGTPEAARAKLLLAVPTATL